MPVQGRTLPFCTDIVSQYPPIPNSMKIRPMGSESFHADGQTDEYDEIITRLSVIS